MFLSLYIKYFSDVDAYVNVSFKIMNKENKVAEENSSNYILVLKNQKVGFPRFMKHNFLFRKEKDILVDDKLSIICDIVLDKVPT